MLTKATFSSCLGSSCDYFYELLFLCFFMGTKFMNKDTLFEIQHYVNKMLIQILSETTTDTKMVGSITVYGLDNIVRTGWLFPDDINLNYLLFPALTSIFNKTQFTWEEAEILQSPIYSLSFNANEYSSTKSNVTSSAKFSLRYQKLSELCKLCPWLYCTSTQ